MKYYLGVDVGTSSVRVGLFNQNGELIDHKVNDINVYNFKPDFYEQSSNEIWQSILKCINKILEFNDVKNDIISIGFDATCSLVVLDENFNPITVSPSKDSNINIIMWMDHRSIKQAEFINSTNYSGLKNIGGSISPEMDPPKILWLKQNLNEDCYKKAAYFFSLPDYLVFKCTGQDLRSVCTTTCKWLYKSEPNCKEWDAKFWSLIGLDDLIEDNFSKIGSFVEKPFKFCENLRISQQTIQSTGLNSNVKIGVSMIDAHAGGIGGICITYGFLNSNKTTQINSIEIEDILVLVSGTSSCFMASAKTPKFINGIWGPYYEAMIPDMWLNEGGQSASGKLIDHIIQTHPAYQLIKDKVNQDGIDSNIYEYLNKILIQLAKEKNLNNISLLTRHVHIYPDFHGNRSPLSDPNISGQIHGLNFNTGLENLALLYLASIQSIAYQTRHVIEIMNSNDIKFEIINIIGGLAQNNLYTQLISDVCNLPVLIPKSSDTAVLFGSAILGASNSEDFRNLSFRDLIKSFSHSNTDSLKSVLLTPNESIRNYHQLKYNVYKLMIEDHFKYRKIMNS